jgi:hypothetical protein
MISRTRALWSSAVLAATLLAALALAGLSLLRHAGLAAWRPAEAPDGARLAVRGGLGVMQLAGTPGQRGRQAGLLVGRQAADLLAVMRLNPMAAAAARGARLPADLAALRASDRAELQAFADAAGLDIGSLVMANATIETMCSAAAHPASGRVARNMDFFPPGPLGQATVLQIVREPGRLDYAAVGWPGMVGVISGINRAGLSACILLNWKGAEPPAGEPLALRVRAILQDCATVAEGEAAMRAAPVGSRHYVLLMDARDAAVAWWTPDGPQVDRPRDGWLVASNWIRDGGVPRADDLRGGCLLRACAALGGAEPDPAWFRRVLSASYMPLMNAQAMVLDHRARRLELALAQGNRPAALQPWYAIELGPVLDGADAATLAVERLPAEAPMPHYLLGR